jgi:serine/threonine protein kinase/tetratricopeptide (TPR) repeat protein
MTPETYERAWALFDEAQQRSSDERQAFLDERCATDTELRAEVEKLLAEADRGKPAFLPGQCLITLKGQLGAPAQDNLLGRHIGPYEIQKHIASGGMGSVYLAVRHEDFHQRVAIKAIKPGLGAGEVLRRFRAERQVLARLAHPNIARLLDGGTFEGLPYFVMEYVDGVPIDRYCNEHNLDIRGRLRLFLIVCAAVHYAHQNLILHRDLKPGNVLVESNGNPKLVDFGIAKVLAPEESPDALTQNPQTQQGTHFATPDYASPEQLRGDSLPSTACDVYALGVILYELLTSHRPHERTSESLYELIRRVCEDDPVPPRQHRPALPRDLEVICLKCLRKKPAERLPSVAALAEELQRYLNGEPIHSRPTSVLERGVKWVRRRPVAAAFATTSVLALAAIVAVVLWDNHQLNVSNRKVAASEQVVTGLLGDFIGVLGDDGHSAPPDVSVRQLRIIEKRIRQLIAERHDELVDNARLGQRLGQLLKKIGEQYYLLGQDQDANSAFEAALELQRNLVARFTQEAEYRDDLAETLHAVSVELRRAQAFTESAERSGEAVRLHRELAAEYPDVAKYREDLARHLHHLADLHKDKWPANPTTADLAVVDGLFAESREVLLKLIDQHPDEVRYQLALAANLHSWGHALFRAGPGHYDEARAEYDRAVALFDALLAHDTTAPDARHERARLLASTAILLEKQGQREAARQLCQQAVDVQRDLAAIYPTVTKYRFELARNLTHLGDLLVKDDRPKAEEAYRAAERERRRLLNDLPWRANYHGELGVLLWRIAERTPPDGSTAVRALLTEASALLSQATKLGAKSQVYDDARLKIQKRLEQSPGVRGTK